MSVRGNAVSAILEPPPRAPTLADLYNRFGDMPAWRFRLHPFPATEEDVVEIHDRENRLFELVDGILLEKTMGWFESVVAVRLARILGAYVDSRGLGFVSGPDGMMKVLSKKVYMPDVAYVKADQFPAEPGRGTPVPAIHPNLAIEVLSENNTVKEIKEKRGNYFKAGTEVMWVVDPEARTIAVHLPSDPENPRVLNEGDTIDGAPALPEFRLQIATLFERLAR